MEINLTPVSIQDDFFIPSFFVIGINIRYFSAFMAQEVLLHAYSI